ncbi:hypothetical protein Leryth_004091 [Lithospermum erythrorhizon]|nr:hypothetical protein Leryth_004091 [Lithospermum erythrorhizon]
MVQESRNEYKGVKWYVNKRKGYQKLHGSSQRMNPCVVVMGGSGNCKKRRFNWRMKLNKKLKFKFKFSISPKKFLIGFRDGYINFMNKIANSSMVTGGGFVGSGGGYGGNVMNGFRVKTLKEYDEKMIVEIYKSLVISQTQLAPCDVAKFGRHVICSRTH